MHHKHITIRKDMLGGRSWASYGGTMALKIAFLLGFLAQKLA